MREVDLSYKDSLTCCYKRKNVIAFCHCPNKIMQKANDRIYNEIEQTDVQEDLNPSSCGLIHVQYKEQQMLNMDKHYLLLKSCPSNLRADNVMSKSAR